jgi:transcription antitermination factor NusA-like protein
MELEKIYNALNKELSDEIKMHIAKRDNEIEQLKNELGNRAIRIMKYKEFIEELKLTIDRI